MLAHLKRLALGFVPMDKRWLLHWGLAGRSSTGESHRRSSQSEKYCCRVMENLPLVEKRKERGGLCYFLQFPLSHFNEIMFSVSTSIISSNLFLAGQFSSPWYAAKWSNDPLQIRWSIPGRFPLWLRHLLLQGREIFCRSEWTPCISISIS